MKKILFALVMSIFVIGCEHDDCYDHDCNYRNCRYPAPIITDVRGYLEEHAVPMVSFQYQSYFGPWFNVYGPIVYDHTPEMESRKIKWVVQLHVDIDSSYGYLYAYTRFHYPPTGDTYFVVEYYR